MVNWLREKLILYIAITFIVLLIIIMSILYIVMDNSFYNSAKKNAFSITNSIYISLEENIFDSARLITFVGNDPFISNVFFENEEENTLLLNAYLSNATDIYSFDSIYIASFDTNNYYSKDGLVKTFNPDDCSDEWFFNLQSNNDTANPYQTLLTTNANSELYLNSLYFIKDNNGITKGFVLIGIDYYEVLSSIESIVEELNAKVYVVNYDGKINSSLGVSTQNEAYICEVLPFIDVSSFSKESGSSFNHFVEEKLSISYKYMEYLNGYIIVTQPLSTNTRYTFILTIIIIIFILTIIALVVMKLMNYSNNKIMHHASVDSLTGAYNRSAFNKKLSESIELSTHYKILSSLIFIDIDNFKQINDLMGHDIGDEIITKVATLLDETKRKNDILFRWGGDEFAIIARCNLEDSLNLSQRILDHAHQIIWRNNSHVTLSIGVSEIHPQDTKKEAFHRADQSLYRSKKNGKDQINYE